MLRFEDIVFGPIHSRRLGSSLGINLLPSDGKVCNFDCVYCECGWNLDGISEKKEFPSVLEVFSALTLKLNTLKEKGEVVDSITFSGNGEPTLHPEFAAIVYTVAILRDKLYPNAKISVLSNATNLSKPGVIESLKLVDNPILKLDAVSAQGLNSINKPSLGVNIDDILSGLESFKGDFILQTMFLRSHDFDSTNPDFVQKWMEIVRKLKPRSIMVYSLDRETPDKTLIKVSIEEMNEIVKPLVEEGYSIGVY